MKLKVLSILAASGLAVSSYGQGILLQNVGNTGAQTDTSNGLVYEANGDLYDGFNYNLGVEVYVGSTSSSLSLLGTFVAPTDPKTYTGYDAGMFQLGNSEYDMSSYGVSAGGTVFIQLFMWFDGLGGDYASYAAAQGGGGRYGSSSVFGLVTSNPNGAPPTFATGFDTMPSVTLVPEPSTFALAGLGLAFMAIRRRK